MVRSVFHGVSFIINKIVLAREEREREREWQRLEAGESNTGEVWAQRLAKLPRGCSSLASVSCRKQGCQ